MRIFTWAGAVALAAAASVGYMTCELVHQSAAVGDGSVCDAVEFAEASEAPPADGPQLGPVEVIDLACVPAAVQMSQFLQTTEPPLAAPALLPSGLRTVNFEVPLGSPDGPEPAPLTLPYLKDDDDPPAKLPMLGDDRPMMPPATLPNGPLFDSVLKYFQNATTLPVTDKVPLGQPPVCERPLVAEIGADCEPALSSEKFVGPPKPEGSQTAPASGEASEAPPARVPQRLDPAGSGESRPQVDTMEIRPGDVLPRTGSDPY